MGSSYESVQFGVGEESSYLRVYPGTLPFVFHMCGFIHVSYLAETSRGTVRAERLWVGT